VPCSECLRLASYAREAVEHTQKIITEGERDSWRAIGVAQATLEHIAESLSEHAHHNDRRAPVRADGKRGTRGRR
jgi:hypothetical protein